MPNGCVLISSAPHINPWELFTPDVPKVAKELLNPGLFPFGVTLRYT